LTAGRYRLALRITDRSGNAHTFSKNVRVTG
jgi:hypothetical protein